MSKKQEEFPITLKSDTTIKYVYMTNDGKKWLDNLINATIGVDLTDFELYYNELPAGNKANKDMRTDFMLKNGRDICILEVQNSKHDANKGYLYLFRVTGNKMTKKDSYDTYLNSKRIFISINDFIPEDNEDIKDEKPEFLHITACDARFNYQKNIFDAYEILLPNLKKLDYTCIDDARKGWQLFFCEGFEEMKRYKTEENKGILNVIRDLEMNSDFLSEYEKEQVEEAMIGGIKDEAKQEEKLEIAKNLLKLNVPIDTIVEATRLSKEEIEEL